MFNFIFAVGGLVFSIISIPKLGELRELSSLLSGLLGGSPLSGMVGLLYVSVILGLLKVGLLAVSGVGYIGRKFVLGWVLGLCYAGLGIIDAVLIGVMFSAYMMILVLGLYPLLTLILLLAFRRSFDRPAARDAGAGGAPVMAVPPAAWGQAAAGGAWAAGTVAGPSDGASVAARPSGAGWVTADRILVLAAVAVLLTSTILPWFWSPQEAKGTVGSLLGALAKAANAEGAVRQPYNTLPYAIALAVIALAAAGPVFAPKKVFRAAAWLGLAALAAGMLVYLVWDHGIQMRVWGEPGMGVSFGFYAALGGCLALWTGALLAGWSKRVLGVAAWLVPVLGGIAAIVLLTNVFGWMSLRVNLQLSDVKTAPPEQGAPSASVTFLVRNSGWEDVRLIEEGPSADPGQNGVALRLLQQDAKGAWQSRPVQPMLVGQPLLTAAMFLPGGSKGNAIARVTPRGSSNIVLSFSPCWNRDALLDPYVPTREGRWALELRKPGGGDAICRVEFDVPGRKHPDLEYLRDLASVEERLRAGDSKAALEILKSLSSPTPACPGEAVQKWTKLKAQAAGDMAGPLLKAIEEALPDVEKKKDLAVVQQWLNDLSACPPDPKVAVMQRRLEDLRRAWEGDKQWQQAVEAAIARLDFGTAYSTLARHRQSSPQDADRLEKSLVRMAQDQIHARLDAAKFDECLDLIRKFKAVEASKPLAEQLGDHAWKCAQGLLGEPTSAGATAGAMKLAEELNPKLASVAEFAYDRLRVEGQAATIKSLRKFLTDFPSHAKTTEVLLAVAGVYSAKLAAKPALDEDFAACLSACQTLKASSPAAAQAKAAALLEALQFAEQLDNDKAAAPDLLKRASSLHKLLARLRAEKHPPPAGASPGKLPQEIVTDPNVLAGMLARLRQKLGWGTSLGEDLDGQEVEITVKLNPVTARGSDEVKAALDPKAGHLLVMLNCNSADLQPAEVSALQRWVMQDGGCAWLSGTDLVKSFGLTAAAQAPKAVRTPLAPVRPGPAFLGDLPANMGTLDLPAGAYVLPQNKEVRGLVPLLTGTFEGGKGHVAAILPFGKGRVVFFSKDIGRDNKDRSLLAFGIKKYLTSAREAATQESSE